MFSPCCHAEVYFVRLSSGEQAHRPCDFGKNDQGIVGIILSHICWGTSGLHPGLPYQLVGVPVMGALKEVGIWKRGLQPPGRTGQFSLTPVGVHAGESKQ